MENFGVLSSHMFQHLVLMNVYVPLLVFAVRRNLGRTKLWRTWPCATTTQIVLLWGWHAPSVLPLATGSPLLMLAMHLSLTASAVWFWLSIATMPADGTWRAIFALLVTGKLFCLLGALLVFAPNVLYEFGASADQHHSLPMNGMALGDQQTAGMLMLIACPLTYVGAGIVLAGQWFLKLERGERDHV